MNEIKTIDDYIDELVFEQKESDSSAFLNKQTLKEFARFVYLKAKEEKENHE